MGTILIVAGRDRGSYYPLAEAATVIGRDESCDIQIVDEMISRRHAQVTRREDVFERCLVTIIRLDIAPGIIGHPKVIQEAAVLGVEKADG